MGRKKTHDEYVEELKNKNLNVNIVGTYVNAKTPVMHICLIHNKEWLISPTNVLSGKRCPICANKSRSEKMSMTHDEYVSMVKEENKNIEVIGLYVNAHTKIKHRCVVHDISWDVLPYSITGKHSGCYMCAKEKFHKSTTKTNEQYIYDLSIKNPNLKLIGEYCGNKTKISHLCKTHNKLFDISPDNALKGEGCELCKKDKISIKKHKTHNQYLNELKQIDSDIIPIDEYIYSLTPIKHKCLKCSNVWDISPSNVLTGYGCPRCKFSNGEKRICKFLELNNIDYNAQFKFNDCKDILPLPFDFYISQRNIAIEYDGEQHFRPIDYFGGEEKFKITKQHDEIKNEYCKNNGIKLLRIPYYKNIEEELNKFLFN